ncbi:MAG: hypothetical protein GX985_01575 [Gallicola sp.]|nr:hypothetical protein [Gallicola sp.]
MRKKIFIGILLIIILIPIVNLNTEENQVSTIDNRTLTDLFPEDTTSQKQNLDFHLMSMQFEDYLSDRIGFREEMLGIYGNGYNSIFGVLKHPSYEYGKEKEVFYSYAAEPADKEFVDNFNNFMGTVQRYLEVRGIDFVFAANPSKNDIYPEKLPDSVHTSYGNMEYLRTLLPNNFFTSIDNVEYLQNVDAQERIFDEQYDVGHWTDYGAILGISNMIEPMREKHPNIGSISFEEYQKEKIVQEYLPNSKIKINQEITKYHSKNPQHVNPKEYQAALKNELKLHPTHSTLRIDQNPNNPDAPSLLIFRGSFMNGKEDFYTDDFSEVIGIHNYENIFDIDYYLNLFKPDIVLFEVAASAFNEGYFNPNAFWSVHFNPKYENLSGLSEVEASQELLDQIKVNIQKKDILTDIAIQYPEQYNYLYLEASERIHDTHPSNIGNGILSTYCSVYNDTFKDVKLILVEEKDKTKTIIPLDKLL